MPDVDGYALLRKVRALGLDRGEPADLVDVVSRLAGRGATDR